MTGSFFCPIKHALLVPQQATFDVADHRYVYVVDKDHVIHQRKIDISNELNDFYVVKGGVSVEDTNHLQRPARGARR